MLKRNSTKYGKKYAKKSWTTSGKLTQFIERLARAFANLGRSAPPPQ